MQTGTNPPISCVAMPEDDREGQGLIGGSFIRGESPPPAPAGQQVADRVQRLLEAIESLAKADTQSIIPAERLMQVDAIQEHLLEQLDELSQLLHWQLERLVRERLGSTLAGTTT